MFFNIGLRENLCIKHVASSSNMIKTPMLTNTICLKHTTVSFLDCLFPSRRRVLHSNFFLPSIRRARGALRISASITVVNVLASKLPIQYRWALHPLYDTLNYSTGLLLRLGLLIIINTGLRSLHRPMLCTIERNRLRAIVRVE